MNRTDWIVVCLIFIVLPFAAMWAPQNKVEDKPIGYRPTFVAPVAETVTSKAWYTWDINHANCFQSDMSPADRVRDYQSWGVRAQTDQLSSGAVQVGDDSSYYTYFPSMGACLAALPRSKTIPVGLE